MSQTQILIEVHCLRPSWVAKEDNRYRVYINNELITERTWIWDSKTIIDENIWVSIIPSTLNSVRVEAEPIPSTSMVKFGLKNLRINGNIQPDQQDEQSELSFII